MKAGRFADTGLQSCRARIDGMCKSVRRRGQHLVTATNGRGGRSLVQDA